VADKSFRIVDASNAVLIGQQDIPQYKRMLSRALAGKTVVSTPFPSVVMMQDAHGQVRTGEPTMYVCSPLRDERFQVVGVLGLQLRPEREFTQILQLGQIGASGETYAFDRNGVMVSNSRFDEDLILLGILADREHSRSILNVMVRDPQGDMTQGYRPDQRRAEMQLTKMAADATEGNSGVDVEGYRDYRGVPVVGAWTWLPEYEIGVTTEIDVAEAFAALTILQNTFWLLFALLVVSSVAIFVFTVIVARLQREARKAAIESQQLGQYTLEEQIGAGAMGVVYRGHHAMLRRPTAIKLLDADKVTDAAIEKFEREVQITCRLNHPSTIQIYDYGRTPEGVFYYAMEYLDGIDLQTLVDKDGPQPGSRVIHILLQACGSLYEAHSQGLVHRDIKPANIMINCRGGESDVVKVLDFGLVKAIDDPTQASQTSAGGLTGTPLYMSPEAIQSPMSVDARSDLYGLGAVGYFLLTGQSVFVAEGIVELCQKHVDEVPVAPSERLGKHVSSELENALLSCLEKSRAKRPQTARDLAQLLAKCPETSDWSIEKAEAWWRNHERRSRAGSSPPDESPNASTTSQSRYDRTIDSH
jgi:serine/threonine protein kinase